MSKGLDPDQTRHSVIPDLDPNCLWIYQQIWNVIAKHTHAQKFCQRVSSYHNHIFDLHAGTGASSTSVGPLSGNWLAACIADLTLLLYWGSPVVSFHSCNFLSRQLGPPPALRLPSTCVSHAESDCTTRMLHMPKPAKSSYNFFLSFTEGRITLVNVYVDLVVFTRIAGTS